MRDAMFVEKDEETGYWDVLYVVSIGMTDPVYVSSWDEEELAEACVNDVFMRRLRNQGW